MLINLPRHLARCAVALVLIFALARPTVRAYNLNNSQWEEGPISLVFALGSPSQPLQDGSTSWDAVAKRAIGEWNGNLGLVRFASVVDDGASPSQGDKKNTVAFSDTLYGDDFGDETVAVTALKYDGTTGYINEADVLVNHAYTFDAYDGPLHDSGTNPSIDLHRVLLHEFGHVLGLLHPDAIGQTVGAVMNSVVSNTDQLTADDTEGATAIYGDSALESLNILARNLTVEDGRGKVYVTTFKANGKGRLSVIDPYLPAITASVGTGPKPGVLTESDGGEHLYLGVDGKGVIDQIDPDTLAVTQEIALGAQAGVTAADIDVLPGAPESLLVSQVGNVAGAVAHNSPATSANFAVYDNGVRRPEEEFDSYDTAGSAANLDNSGQTFYAFVNTFGDGEAGSASRLTVEAAGVSSQVQPNILPTAALDGGASFRNGRLYGSDGSVADLEAGVYDEPFGDVQSAGGAEVLTVDENLDQAYFAVPRDGTTADNHEPTLLVESIHTRSRLGNIALPRYIGLYRLRRWGANGLLFCVDGGRMFFIRSTLLAPGPVTGPPVAVTLGGPNYALLNEGDDLKAKLKVTRTNSDLSTPLTVRYTVAGTAQSGTDYRALSGVVTIPAGQMAAKIKVVPTGSHFSDGLRSVQIRLTPELPYIWGTSSTATVSLTGGG